MKISTLLVASFVFVLSARAFGEVLVYAGSIRELRPGANHRAARASLVVELDEFRPPSVTVVVPGKGHWEFLCSRTEINDYTANGLIKPGSKTFFLFIGKNAVEGRSETNLQLTSNASLDWRAVYRRPQSLVGRLTTIQKNVGVVLVIIDGMPPASPQAADFSELSLSFSFDWRRTLAAKNANRSFQEVVHAAQFP